MIIQIFKKNIILTAALVLPLCLVSIFFLAEAINQKLHENSQRQSPHAPLHKVLFYYFDYDMGKMLNYHARPAVEDGYLKVKLSYNSIPEEKFFIPKIFTYDTKNNLLEELNVSYPDNIKTETDLLVPLDAESRIDTNYQSPDGAVFQMHFKHSNDFSGPASRRHVLDILENGINGRENSEKQEKDGIRLVKNNVSYYIPVEKCKNCGSLSIHNTYFLAWLIKNQQN
jgi:hypothetical protein